MHVLPLIYAFLNLIILAVFLSFVLKKSVKASLLARKEDFIKKSKESHDFYNSSIDRLEKTKSKIANIQSDGSKYLQTITENSTRLSNDMVVNAKRMADTIIEDAGQRAEAEVRHTRNRIVSSFVDKVIDETRTKLKKDVNDLERNEYIDEYSKLSKTERGVQ